MSNIQLFPFDYLFHKKATYNIGASSQLRSILFISGSEYSQLMAAMTNSAE